MRVGPGTRGCGVVVRVAWIVALTAPLLAGCPDATPGTTDTAADVGADVVADTGVAADSDTDAVGADLPASTATVVINEVCPAPVTGTDWFELYIGGEGVVDLSQYQIVDDNTGHTPVTLSGQFPAGSYVVVQAVDAAPADGSAWVGFKLGSGDALTLTLVDGSAVDSVDWASGDAPEGATWGRLPDGGTNLQQLTPTPGAANEDIIAGPAATPFVTDRVIKVTLELSAEAWAAIQADPLAEEYHSGSIVFDGQRLDEVAIRTKGNSSLKSTAEQGSIRFPFKVDINYYVSGQRLLGVKKLSLGNGFRDPSHMREHVTMGVMRDFGLIAPLTSHVDLWVNDTHLGLYTLSEMVDGTFLEDHFATDTGDLYKPEPPSGDLQWAGDTFASYASAELKTNEATSDGGAFVALVDALANGSTGVVADALDVDAALRYLAVSAFLVNLDSYLGPGHNYYLYAQGGQSTLIPWDANMSFGGFTCSCTGPELTALFIDEPVCGTLASKPLVARLLADPVHLATYEGYLTELANGHLSPASLSARVHYTAGVIRDTVAADPTMDSTLADFEDNLTEDVQLGNRTSFGLVSFVEARGASIAAQLAGTEPRGNAGAGTCDAAFGGGGPSPPTSCEVEADCADACPAGAVGCTCFAIPNDGKRCIPTCTQDADCPTIPNGPTLVCMTGSGVCGPG